MSGYVHQKRTLDRVNIATDVYTLALERTAYVMETFDRVQVNFSGGKDSTAVLNVALAVAHSDPKFARHLPLRVIFWDEEAIPQETADYVARMAARDDIAMEWYCLPVQHRNACSREHPWWWPWAPEDQAKWCRPLPEQAITELPGFPIWPAEARMSIPAMAGLLAPPPQTTAALLGIRAQESLTRLRAVTRRAVDNYVVPHNQSITNQGNLFKAYPIYDWRTEDVWAATRAFDWDYNKAYDLLEMAGISPSLQRCSPAFGEEPLQKIHTYAACFPDVWAKMAERVPGIGAAQRYALTELYAYRDRPVKPTDMPWPDFLMQYVAKFQPKDQRMIAGRIRDEMSTHYRKVRDPIVHKAYHPQTGISWDFLLMLAMRGDFKKRKQPGGKIQRDKIPHMWAKYVAEVAEIGQSGTVAEYAYPRPWPADATSLLPDDIDLIQ